MREKAYSPGRSAGEKQKSLHNGFKTSTFESVNYEHK